LCNDDLTVSCSCLTYAITILIGFCLEPLTLIYFLLVYLDEEDNMAT